MTTRPDAPVTSAIIATDIFATDGAVLAATLERTLKSAILYCDVIEIGNVGPALFPSSPDGQFAMSLSPVTGDERLPPTAGAEVRAKPGINIIRKPFAGFESSHRFDGMTNRDALTPIFAEIDVLVERGLVAITARD